MYARLRQKFAIAGSSTSVTTTTALGSNAVSLIMKDLARLMTGAITSTAGLNSEIWDIPNCEVVNNVAAGWSEYQTNYTTTSTNIPNSSAQANGLYLRTLSANNTYKYAALSWTANGSGTAYWRMLYPYDITDYLGNPTLTFKDTTGAASAWGAPVQEASTRLHEHILYVSPRCIFWSAMITTATQPFAIHSQLEYPNTPLSTLYNHPNQVIWSLYNGNAATTTGTGAGFGSAGYNLVGGYNAQSPPGNTATNSNLALVYTHYPNAPAGGFNSLWSSGTAAADASTMKPSIFGSMANTVDNAGNTIGIPAMPLIHYPSWDTVYDCSTLTGVYATKPSLGASGDTITLNGQTYAYINATTMGYLIPRQ